jgi:hypothetical protein
VTVVGGVNATVGGMSSAKVAVTERGPSMRTAQSPDPAQSPVHPVNCEPGSAVAVSVTDPPSTNGVVQTSRQAMPAGTLCTDPEPGPAADTESG